MEIKAESSQKKTQKGENSCDKKHVIIFERKQLAINRFLISHPNLGPPPQKKKRGKLTFYSYKI